MVYSLHTDPIDTLVLHVRFLISLPTALPLLHSSLPLAAGTTGRFSVLYLGFKESPLGFWSLRASNALSKGWDLLDRRWSPRWLGF